MTKFFAIYATNSDVLHYAGPADSYSGAIHVLADDIAPGMKYKDFAADMWGVEITKAQLAVIDTLEWKPGDYDRLTGYEISLQEATDNAVRALEKTGLGKVETDGTRAWITTADGRCLGLDAEGDDDVFAEYCVVTDDGQPMETDDTPRTDDLTDAVNLLTSSLDFMKDVDSDNQDLKA